MQKVTFPPYVSRSLFGCRFWMESSVAVIWFVLFLPLVLNHTNYLDSSLCFLKDSGNISAGSAAFRLLLHLDEEVRSGALKEKFCVSKE